MTAALAIARAELRQGWRGLLLVALLAGVVGATVIGALSLARRTTTAYDRLGAVTAVDDARGTITSHVDLLDDIVALPQVTASWTGRIGVAQILGQNAFLGVVSGPERPSPLLHPLVLEGRLPVDDGDPDTVEIALRDDFQREFHVPIGTEVPVRFLSEADYYRFDTGFEGGEPHGPEMTLRVVGTIRLAGGASGASGVPGFAAPDLVDRPDAMIGGSFYVRLAEGGRSFDEFRDAAEALGAGRTLPPEAAEFAVVDVTETAQAEVAVEHTAGLLGRALLALAVAVGLAGTVAVAQIAARQSAGRAAEQAVASALGFTRAQRLLARLVTAAGPALGALLVAAVGSVAAAGLQPAGAIRLYEPHDGPALNLAIVAPGLVAVVAVVIGALVGAGALAELRRTDRPMRESRLAEGASRLGGAPEAVIGLRFALEPGRGRRTVPVRSAITGAVIGVAGVVAGLVFAASLDRLVASPARSAVPFDLLVADVDDADLAVVADDPAVGTLVRVDSAPIEVAGRSISSHALTGERGALAIDLEAGRLPRTPDETTLGIRVARDLEVGIGDTITVTDATGDDHPVAVVGVGVVPPFNNEQLGLNALLTPEGLDRLAATRPFSSAAVVAAPGADLDALDARLSDRFESDTQRIPTEVDNLRQLGALPALVAGLVGVVALIALANALVVAVRRRRADLALLRAIGFTSDQAGRSIVVMALVIAGLGLTIGVPLGMAAGSSLWRVTAAGAFVTTDSLVRWSWVGVLSLGTLVLALVAAIVPSRRAARLPAAALLRSE